MDATRVDLMGPWHDRRWMLVDDEGQCLTQRTQPRMVLITPRFEGEDLMVEAPNMPALRIRNWCGEGDSIAVQIWEDTLHLPHPSTHDSEWFSAFLGQPCRLVYLPDAVVRPVEAPWNGCRVSLADAYPVLVIGQASLDLLNEKLDEAVTMARFRPNLVVAGCAAHEEDGWRRVRIGEVELATVKACKRCAIPLVDPLTAATGGHEPLRTLAEYRKAPAPSTKVIFGQNALVTVPGVLRVGQTVELLAEEEAGVHSISRYTSSPPVS